MGKRLEPESEKASFLSLTLMLCFTFIIIGLIIGSVFFMIALPIVSCIVMLIGHMLEGIAKDRLAEDARIAKDSLAEDARRQGLTVKLRISQLKSKIKDFKEKGIKIDELELILGKVEKEMINEQSPVILRQM